MADCDCLELCLLKPARDTPEADLAEQRYSDALPQHVVDALCITVIRKWVRASQTREGYLLSGPGSAVYETLSSNGVYTVWRMDMLS